MKNKKGQKSLLYNNNNNEYRAVSLFFTFFDISGVLIFKVLMLSLFFGSTLSFYNIVAIIFKMILINVLVVSILGLYPLSYDSS